MPIEEKLIVISYEGVHVVPLLESKAIEYNTQLAEGGANYDENRQVLVFENRKFPMLGLYGGMPLLQSPSGERLSFGRGDFFQVHNREGIETFRYEFNDLSGDWRHVTFSEDGKFILLGLPYALQIFERSEGEA